MTFSVVIPLYNKALYVEETLASLALQSKKPFELIIVDDNSTDDSLRVVKDYIQRNQKQFEKTRIEIIELTANYGVGYARNIGFSKATGDLVSFLDADDIYEKDLLKTASLLMQQHSIDFLVVGIQLFPSNVIYPDVKKIAKELFALTNEAYYIKQPLKTVTSHNFYMGVGSNVIFKRENGLSEKYIEQRIFYEGIDYWYRIVKKMVQQGTPKIGLLMGEYLKVREVAGSASRKKYEKWNEIDFPPVLSRFKNSNDYYDKRLMGVVGSRWIEHAMCNLNSVGQKLKFMVHYIRVFLKQGYYFFLHKF
ncbi:glycosyltransferase family 2 protein [Tenacibaculum tangerinum]|uniref:Glycosyltransferase family 2 protein n=1 Tax=Tenacibaculum tangerinum TaxID=3038772 RepID=A0ABY8L440_9FLAO|nr:glycosyltransferase family 2 protein [Tenacibaculum tangerinum]WGH76196.1 glycosyltransferase family 2 protein [Tenacibaculum tangerinum]